MSFKTAIDPTTVPAMKPLGMVFGELRPTLTYTRREYVWLPADPAHPAWDRRLGNLTITLSSNKGRNGRIESDCYAVEEMPPEPNLMARSFYLLNLTDPDQDEPYIVRIGRVNTCSCKAGKCKQYACKHADAIAELLLDGVLPVEYEHPAAVAEAARWAAAERTQLPPADFDDELNAVVPFF